MKTLKLRDTVIGEGIPKIAVSIIGKTKEEIESLAKRIDPGVVDILEWRADFYDDVFQIKNVLEILRILRNLVSDMPIIFTFRTKSEGGEKDIDTNYYIDLNKAVAETRNADLIDVEIFLGNKILKETIQYIHNQGVYVIGSNHDFTSTPKKKDIIKRVLLCENLGADIIKVSFMPNSVEDIINLLSVTNYVNNQINRPIITIAMGKLGIITRISGETFGSSVTFGSMGKVSAPGQIPVENLKTILHYIHEF